MWNFLGQQTIRVRIDKLVAVKKKLGWVVSGPSKVKMTEKSEACKGRVIRCKMRHRAK